MLLTPEQYSTASVKDLLEAAARGRAGVDRRLMRAIIDRGPAAVPEIVAFGLGESRYPVDLSPDLVAMLRHLRSPEALPYFVELIRREPYDTDAATSAILEIGAPAVEPLLALYQELGEEAGGEVAFLLGALRTGDKRILDLLLNRLESDPHDALMALALHGDAAALPAIEKLKERAANDATLSRDIETALEDLSADPPTRHEHAEPEEFDVFEEYPERAEPAWIIIPERERLEFLDSASAEQRAAAAASFFNAEFGGAVRRRLLELAQRDPDPNVRGRAWETLYGLLDDAEIHEAMFARLRGGGIPKEELGGLLVGLSELASEAEVRPAVLGAYEDPATRAKALEAMWRSADRRFADYFPPNLRSSDEDIRRQAIWGVGRLGIVSEISRLRELFDHPDFRDDALFAYALAAPGTVSPARMRALFRKVEDMAGGLSESESHLLGAALDDRLMRHGYDPVFEEEGEEEEGEEEPEAAAPAAARVGRNDPCPCGSGKKYKKCCGQ